jgi:hypothetical protein
MDKGKGPGAGATRALRDSPPRQPQGPQCGCQLREGEWGRGRMVAWGQGSHLKIYRVSVSAGETVGNSGRAWAGGFQGGVLEALSSLCVCVCVCVCV